MKNKNDVPVENIDNCFLIENFKFLGEFSKLAILQPSVKNEKIIINKVLDNKYFNNNGLVYILVIGRSLQLFY